MASTTDNPFLNPARLPAPSKVRAHARKVSRSPVRQDVREFDSLLRDLSPTSTLRAFVTDPNDSADLLVTGIRSATMSERGLGAKAAQTCLDLRNWTRELEHWDWPGTFEEPRLARKQKQLVTPLDGRDFHSSDGSTSQHDEEYWGSLPARLVREYERRADEIGQGLDNIDVEELKSYVLNSHYRLNSQTSFSGTVAGGNSSATLDFKKLDDFMALVTATILQALPFLSRLNQLLDLWTMRLIILREAPRFLCDLKRVQTDLENCWVAIAPSPDDAVVANDGKTFTRATLSAMKVNIETQLGVLGRRLDRFLDSLEGRNECVPDSWIDDFESCEANYSMWAVQAERTAIRDECGSQLRSTTERHSSETSPKSSIDPTGMLSISETEDPTSDNDVVRRPSQSLRSSIDEAQLANSLLIHKSIAPTQTEGAEPSANESGKNTSRAVSAPFQPIAIGNENEDQTSTVDPIIKRSASTNSQPKDEATGSVAAKRAAFIRNIERNQSLNKSTMSPVRPFERASNAFTRLFSKEKIPEQVLSKRTTSKLADGRIPSVERRALSPVSLASSRLSSTMSPRHSLQSAADSSKSSVEDADETKPSESLSRDLLPTPNGSSSQIAGQHTQDVPLDVSRPQETLTRRPSGSLSSSLNPPNGESCDMGSGLETASMPIATDVLDGTSIESLHEPIHDERKAVRIFKGARRVSFPPSQRLSSADVPFPSKSTEWTSMPRSERRASASPARSRTASGAAITEPIERVPMPRRASHCGSDQLQTRPMQLDSADALPRKVLNDAEATTGEITSSPKVKRASVASIEAFSRSELKSINVPKSSRQNSGSSRNSPPETPAVLSRTQSGLQQDEGASVDGGATAFGPTNSSTTPAPQCNEPSPPSELRTPQTTRSNEVLERISVSPERSAESQHIVMKKLRSGKHTGTLNDASSSSSSTQANSPATAPMHADQFDRHVSEVLERLPAPIRFKARAGAVTPVGRVRGFRTSPAGVPPRGGDMTIAPAEASPRKARTAADSEVKLYHLTHSSRDDPIKLFVRLVGEGERVMVRVGGGWADLASYLYDFANHHGSRTVSEGSLEVIAALPTAPSSIRKFSNPADYHRAKTPTTPRDARPGSSDEDDTPLRPRPFASRERTVSAVQVPLDAAAAANCTPKSSKSGSSDSRPSTACTSRPSSRQGPSSTAVEMGLSGPSSAAKRADLPAEKARWVEGMITRAKKSASAEKNREDKEKYLSELGKVGGTRRVIFKSGTGTGTGALHEKTSK